LASLKPAKLSVLEFPELRSFSKNQNKNTGKNREFFEDDWKDRRFFEKVLWNGEKFEGPPKTNMDTQNCFIWNPCCFYSFLRRLLIVFHTPVGFLLPTVALLLRVFFKPSRFEMLRKQHPCLLG